MSDLSRRSPCLLSTLLYPSMARAMDKAAVGFAQKILEELGTIKKLIQHAIGIPGKEGSYGEAPNQKSNSAQHKQNSVTEATLPAPKVVEFQPPVPSERETYQRKQPHFPKLAEWKHVISLASLVVLMIYTIVTACQWRQLILSNNVAHETLVVGQRAYLCATGAVDNIPSGIKIHISNCGHVRAKIMNGAVSYFRTNVHGSRLDQHFTHLPTGDAIFVMPGSASDFAILITLPSLSAEDEAAISTGAQELAVKVAITFDTGFAASDEFLFGAAYSPESKRWIKINSGLAVNLRDSKKTE